MGRNNRRVKGGRGPVLEKFRTDQSIRALLLPVSAGANGINLTEATHVFFANPLLSAEEEAQAAQRRGAMAPKSPDEPAGTAQSAAIAQQSGSRAAFRPSLLLEGKSIEQGWARQKHEAQDAYAAGSCQLA